MQAGEAEAARKSDRQTYYIKSVERAFSVLAAFDAAHPQLTLAEVAKLTGLDRGAARRFLLTLADLGFIGQRGRLYSLRPRILEVGYAYLSSLSLPEIALPHMESLAREVGESCALSVLDEGDVVFVARVPTRRFVSLSIAIGARFPAHTSSMGRVMLAAQSDDWLERYLANVELVGPGERGVHDREELRRALDEARAQGWAVLDQEFVDGVRSIAVPVRDRTGAVIAALNVSSHADLATVRGFLPAVQEAVSAIEASLGGHTGL